MIDKNEILLPEFFKKSKLLGVSEKLKTSLNTFIIYEDPESVPEIKSQILIEISSTIIKQSLNRISESGSNHYLDLRGLNIQNKNKNLVNEILNIGSGFIIPNNRISSDIGDVSNFIIDITSSLSSLIPNFVFPHGHLLGDDKRVKVFSNAMDIWSSNIIRMVDDIKFDILDIKFEKVDLGTMSSKLNISIDIIIQPVNPKILRVFEEGYEEGIGDWIFEIRNKKIDRIYGKD